MASAESYGWSWYVNDQQDIIVEHNSGMFIGEGITKYLEGVIYSWYALLHTHIYIYTHDCIYIYKYNVIPMTRVLDS